MDSFSIPAIKIYRFKIPILIATCFVVYSNTLFNGFVFDDVGQVLLNRWIREIRYIPEIFSENVWAFQGRATNYYRPLMHIIYLLEYSIFGASSWGFHLTNILFHSTVTVLVFLTGSVLTGESPNADSSSYLSPSFIAGMLFATHPIHTEPVAWIAGIPDLAGTFFYLCSFYIYCRTEGYGKLNAPNLFSIFFFFLATLCKETALTLPFILVAYDYLFRDHRGSFLNRNALKRYLPYLFVTGIYLSLRFHALGGMAPIKVRVSPDHVLSFIDIFPLFVNYLEKLILPIRLNVLHIYRPAASILELRVMISILITIIFIVLAYISWRKEKKTLLYFLLIIIPLIPALYFPGLNLRFYNAFAERYLYLPSFGFVMLFSMSITRISANRQNRAFLVTTISIFLFISYSAISIHRNTAWKDEFSLWKDTLRKSPDSSLAHYNMGKALSTVGKTDEAIEHYRKAIGLQPEIEFFRNGLGDLYHAKGWIHRAIQQYELAIVLQPDDATAYNNLGSAYGDLGLPDKAIGYFENAVKLQPTNADFHYNLGVACLEKDLIDRAIEHLELAVKLNPGDPGSRDTLEKAYGKLKK
jgi:tetratricopeptide (TPR) repeat protein